MKIILIILGFFTNKKIYFYEYIYIYKKEDFDLKAIFFPKLKWLKSLYIFILIIIKLNKNKYKK